MNVKAINEQTELTEEFISYDAEIALEQNIEYEIEVVDDEDNIILAMRVPSITVARLKLKKKVSK